MKGSWDWTGLAPEIVFLAGEHSGDQHAAEIVRELQARHPGCTMAAIGGPALEATGIQLLHNLVEHSVVGLIEVLRHYGEFKALFERVMVWLREHPPKVLVLVDYPGFNLRLAAELKKQGVSRKGGGEVAIYQYISPQIWAWKAGRRFKMAKILDELGVIFPFETECYRDTDLPVRYVGHPFVRKGRQNPVEYSESGNLLALPGSRQQAVGRIFPLMVASYRHYRKAGGRKALEVLCADEALRQQMVRLLTDSEAGAIHFRFSGDRIQACAVLTSSGTMSLNCALAGIPGAILYRAHPLTYWIGKSLVRVEWLGIANLVLGETLYAEFIQGSIRPCELGARLLDWEKGMERERFQAMGQQLQERLAADVRDTAASRILELV